VLILYPNSQSARAVGVRLLETGHCVSIYCPREVDRVKARNIIAELGLVGREQSKIRNSQEMFSVHNGSSFDQFDVLVIQSLDVNSDKSDKQYVKMVNDLFKTLNEKGCSFSPDAHIVFGSNYAGILAAREWGRIWPDSRKQIIVTCSIYQTSVKLCGLNSVDRALPISRSPMKIAFTDKLIKEVKDMEGVWNLDSFPSLEQKATLEVIGCIDKKSFDSMEIVGKYPSGVEAKRFNISAEKPSWLPTSEEDSEGFVDKLKNIPEPEIS